MRRGPAIFLAICLLVASAYGAQRAAMEGLGRVTGFAPTHLTGVRPPAGPPPLAQRLVLILAEGLRQDDARLLPTIDWLAQRGALLQVTVPQPGYAVPAAATLLTGARPEVHGVLLPGGTLRSDNLLAAARRVNLKAGGAGGREMGKLLGPALEGAWTTADEPEALVDQARNLLGPGGPKVVLLHTRFLAAEIARLKTASREEADYRNALAQFDYTLVRLVEQADWKTTAVAVVGLVPTGPTGAYTPDVAVPLVMTGPGVKPGFRATASLTDVASTLGALAGTPTPLPNEGRPIVAALQVADGRPADLILLQVLETRRSYTENALVALGATTAQLPAVPGDAAGADAYWSGLDQQEREAAFAAWRTWGLGLLPYAGPALLLVLIYLAVVWRQPYGGAVLAGALTYGLAFHVIFFLTGGRYSAAMAEMAVEPGRQAVLMLGARSAGAMMLAMLVTGYFFSRKGFKKRAYVATAALHMALTTTLLVALPVAVVLGRTGWEFPVALPGVGLIVWFFVAAVQVMAIGYLSPLWAMLAVSAAALSRRWWPLREVGDPERNADKVVRMRALRRSTTR